MVKIRYATMLVIQCRLSNISCLRPICLSSACRFLSRLSFLMMRFRASTTSLRRSPIPPPPSVTGLLDGVMLTGFTGRGGVISSLICIPSAPGAGGFKWDLARNGRRARNHPMVQFFLHVTVDTPGGALVWSCTGRASGRFAAPGVKPALVAGAAAVVGGEVVQLQSDAEEVAAHVHRGVRGDRIQRGRADRVPVLDHEGEMVGEAEPASQRDEASGGIRLVVGPSPHRGVERVPE